MAIIVLKYLIEHVSTFFPVGVQKNISIWNKKHLGSWISRKEPLLVSFLCVGHNLNPAWLIYFVYVWKEWGRELLRKASGLAVSIQNSSHLYFFSLFLHSLPKIKCTVLNTDLPWTNCYITEIIYFMRNFLQTLNCWVSSNSSPTSFEAGQISLSGECGRGELGSCKHLKIAYTSWRTRTVGEYNEAKMRPWRDKTVPWRAFSYQETKRMIGVR